MFKEVLYAIFNLSMLVLDNSERYFAFSSGFDPLKHYLDLTQMSTNITNMKKQIHLMLAFTCVFAACTKKESDSSTTESAAQPASECYAYTTEKDSAFLHVDITADSIVSGKLEYRLFEKDKNQGKIEGKIHGDTLLANYKFMSEGVESTREVVFLKKDGNWVEGFGPVEEKDGTVVFSDRSKMDFTEGLAFKSAACP